jgi:hypothetical protein
MDYGKALTFITEDPRWQQKIAIGVGVLLISTLLTVVLIGVVGFLIAMGYCVRLLQNVRDGQTYPLPEWDQWGEDLTRGFKLLVISLVWALPLIIITVPTGIGGALTDARSSEAGQFVGSILIICGSCLSMLYGLFLAIVMPGYSIAFARDEQMSSGLRFRDIWAWTQAHLSEVIMVAIIYLVASVAFGLIGVIAGVLLCIVGLIVTIPLATLVTYLFQYHLYGQLAYADSMVGSGRSTVEYPVTPPSEMVPGVSPTPPVEEPPVSSTGEYPGSGIDETTPPTPPTPDTTA